MCTFEVLPLRVDIVNYLVPRWHVSSTTCNLFMCLVWRWCWLSLQSTTGNSFQILLVLVQLVFLYVIEFVKSSSHWLVLICLISCQELCQLPLSSIPLVDLVNFLILSSVFLDIVKVMITSCALCIQIQILSNAQRLGELSYFL